MIVAKITNSQYVVTLEYLAGVLKPSSVAEAFGTTEEVVKDAIDYCDVVRRYDECRDGEEVDKLINELAQRMKTYFTFGLRMGEDRQVVYFGRSQQQAERYKKIASEAFDMAGVKYESCHNVTKTKWNTIYTSSLVLSSNQ